MQASSVAVIDTDLALACNLCGQVKPLEMFVKNKTSANGRSKRCKRCHADEQYARWRAKNPDAPTIAERWARTPEQEAERQDRIRGNAQRRSEAYRRRKGMPVRRKGRDPEKHAAVRARHNAKRRTGPRKPGMTRDERLAKRRANEQEKAYNRDASKARYQRLIAADPDFRARENARRKAARLADPERYRAKARRDSARRRARKAGNPVALVTERDLQRQITRQRGECWWCGEKAKLTIEHVIPISKGGGHTIGNIVMACDSCNKGRCDRRGIEWRLVLLVREMDQWAMERKVAA